MNIKNFLLIGCCLAGLTACAVKEHGPHEFKHYTAKQILQHGEKALAKKNYKDAVRYFEAIDALYPFDPESQQGQLDVIYAYYKSEDYASALAAASRYLHLYPEGDHADYAYYLKGIINFNKDRTALQKIYPRKPEKLDVANLHEAFVNFGELLKKFPHSVYAQDTAERMLYIRNLLAQHELHIAKFYFERQAYVAALNRADYIVRHFVGASQAKEALKLMIKSYRFLGFEPQAQDALRVLNLSFPHEHI